MSIEMWTIEWHSGGYCRLFERKKDARDYFNSAYHSRIVKVLVTEIKPKRRK